MWFLNESLYLIKINIQYKIILIQSHYITNKGTRYVSFPKNSIDLFLRTNLDKII